MPSFPCPHCDAKYGRREVLQTHMQFRHQAAQSSGNQAQGGPRTTSATATAAAATVAIPAGLHRRQLATVMTGPYGPTQRAVTVTMPMAPPSANRFTIVFNARDITGATSMTVPVNEPFAAFLDRLRALSVPVAGRYLQGRTNGFTLADGAWRYSLVDFDGNQADGRRLDSNLYYLTMVSELRRSGSPYAYALVWNVSQAESVRSLLLRRAYCCRRTLKTGHCCLWRGLRQPHLHRKDTRYVNVVLGRLTEITTLLDV